MHTHNSTGGGGGLGAVKDQTIPAVRRQDLQVCMLVPPSPIPDKHVSFNVLFCVVAAHAISPCGILAKAVSWRKIDFVFRSWKFACQCIEGLDFASSSLLGRGTLNEKACLWHCSLSNPNRHPPPPNALFAPKSPKHLLALQVKLSHPLVISGALCSSVRAGFDTSTSSFVGGPCCLHHSGPGGGGLSSFEFCKW